MATTKASQDFVPVREVRNGVIILKNGSYRGILMCSSINFSLKSEDEQRAVIGGFQTFLNSLDFSTQIVVHSRRMDIRPYLALLSERTNAQETELMKIQVREYMQFVQNFAEQANIMTKTFYIVIPYEPASAAVSSVANAIPFLQKAGATASQGVADTFEEHRIQLEQRMSLAANAIASSGVRAVPLGTEEVIELLYRSFNIGELDSPIRLTK